jgi:biopolymer transport protein ExbD
MRRRAKAEPLPEINLVPLLDVMMSVLTFFIIITISFSGKVIQNLENPTGQGTNAQEMIEGPLLLGLNNQKEIVYQGDIVDLPQMQTIVRAYLTQDPQGQIIFKADRSLAYQDIAPILQALADQGGDRVSLTVSQ